jgi:hypothetical protein
MFPDLVFLDRPTVTLPFNLDPWWLTRFTAGDGSFIVSVAKASDRILGIQIMVSFVLVQHSRDSKLFEFIRNQ